MIKGSIQEEDITIINIYALSIGTPQYIRQILTIKGKIDSNMVIWGTLITYSHQRTDHPDRKLIRKHKLYMIHWTAGRSNQSILEEIN